MWNLKLDKLVAFFLLIPVAGFFVLTVVSSFLGIPDEDAAILYSYARNLADTGVIAYFRGGPRVEGATDFGWMVSIALLQKFGISHHVSSGLLNAFFLGLFGHRLWSLRGHFQKPVGAHVVLMALASYLAILFLSGSTLSGLGGFSTIAQVSLLAILFASCLTLCFDTLFLASAIYFVLLRPEGVAWYGLLVACFLVSSFALGTLSKHRVKHWTLLLPLLVFPLYWVARALYFGKLFPLPFEVKQAHSPGWAAYFERVTTDITTNGYHKVAFAMAGLALLLLAAASGYASWKAGKETSSTSSQKAPPGGWRLWLPGILALGVFLVFQSAYLARFHLLQNVHDRFHAPFLGIAAGFFACGVLASSPLWAGSVGKTGLFFLVWGAALLGAVHSVMGLRFVADGYREYFQMPTVNNMYPLSLDLGKLHRDMKLSKLLVTEAGRLSYYSEVPTIDAWGLNSPDYAKQPLQEPEHVRLHSPDLVNMHVDFGRLSTKPLPDGERKEGRACRETGSTEDTVLCGWTAMSQALFDGARALNYSVFVVPFTKDTTSRDRHDLFLVSPLSPVARELEALLLKHQGVRIIQPGDLKQYTW